MSHTIGLIGLGAMGSRIAARLLDAGHPVYGTNRTAAKAEPLLERGLIWMSAPREVAAEADVVLSMVTDDAALEAISAGPQGLLAGLQPGGAQGGTTASQQRSCLGAPARPSARCWDGRIRAAADRRR